MRKPFFQAIPVTMSGKLSKPPTDEELLRAWKDVPDCDVRTVTTDLNRFYDLNSKDHPTGVKSRERIKKLRGLE